MEGTSGPPPGERAGGRAGWRAGERGAQGAGEQPRFGRRPHPRLRAAARGLVLALASSGLGFAGSAPAAAAPSGGAGARGTIAPELRIEGGTCTFAATQGGETLESATGAPLSVAPGTYHLRVECSLGEHTLVPPVAPVTVGPGKTVRPRVEVAPGRVRVEARRGGVMLGAKVSLFPPGGDLTLAPLASFPANQKATVARGKYDVLVVLDDARHPRAEAVSAGVSIGGDRVAIVAADLSDGGLIVAATLNGKRTSATVRAFPPGALRDVGTVEAHDELRLPAGRYVVTTEARDTADFATKKRELWIRAGQISRITETFEAGTLSASVTRDGQPVEATVLVALPGAKDYFNHFAAPGTVTLTPGAYDVSISSRSLGPLPPPARPGVAVARGKHVALGFDLSQASLHVKVVKGGKAIDAEVIVRAAGGGEVVGPPDPVRGAYRLWPGRYEVVARLGEADEVLDGPFEVKLGEVHTRTVSVVRVTLIVTANRGTNAADDAEVLVFRPGASKPTARGRSGSRLELSPGIYDVKVVAGSDVVWKEGVRVKQAQALQVALPTTDKGEPLPEGELPPPSEDLPEGEAPDGEAPAQTSPGGAP